MRTARIGKSFLSFSLTKCNRIGSDELVGSNGKTKQLASTEELDSIFTGSAIFIPGVEKLRRELEEKNEIILELQRQLNEAKGPSKEKRLLGSIKKGFETLTKSHSIRNFSSWIRGFSKKDSSSSSPTSTSASISSSLKSTKSIIISPSNKRPFITPLPNNSSNCDLSMLPDESSQKYSYEQITRGYLTASKVNMERMERHLKEEDLLEYLCICEDFLVFLEPGEIEERKYRAMLSLKQCSSFIRS